MSQDSSIVGATDGECAEEGTMDIAGESFDGHEMEARDSDFGLSSAQLSELAAAARRKERALTASCPRAEARDSDFGLSDRQLEDLWQRFEAGGTCRAAMDNEFDRLVPSELQTSVDKRRSDSGTSEEQLDDSTQHSEPSKGPSDSVPTHGTYPEQSVKDCQLLESLEYFLAKDVPQWKVSVASCRDIGSKSWYLLRIVIGDAKSYRMKQHSDFVEFDAKLRERLASRSGCKLPDLPDHEAFGHGGVETCARVVASSSTRIDAMQGYLEALVEQLPSPDEEPLLQTFFRCGA